MKTKKPLLDKAGAGRLLAAGCSVPMGEDSPPAPDLIVEVRNLEATVAYDFLRSTEFLLDVRITNRSYGRLGIECVKGRPPWTAEHFNWLGDPRRSMPEQSTYRMPSGREIAWESVLNHTLCEKVFEPGESLEGILLAWSMFTRIPMEYLHGETFLLRITLVDQYGRPHRSRIEVRVDRSATMRKVMAFRPFGKGLDAGSPPERPVFDQAIKGQHQSSQSGGGNAVLQDGGEECETAEFGAGGCSVPSRARE